MIRRRIAGGLEGGAGSVLGIALMAALLCAALLVVPFGAVVVGHAKARSVADAAALAAADIARGIRAGAPCAGALEVAHQAGAVLSGCDVDGVIVTVSTSVQVGVWTATASSTAGPPG